MPFHFFLFIIPKHGLFSRRRMMNASGIIFICSLFVACGVKKSEQSPPPTAEQPEAIEAETAFKPGDIFSLTFNLNDTIFVIGKLPLNETIYLLNNEDGSSWKCTAYAHRDYFEEINYQLTMVSPQPPADQRFDIAYAGDSFNNYHTLEKKTIHDERLILKYDSLVKNARLIESLFTQENSFFPDSVISNQTPTLRQLNIPDRRVFIIDYSFYERFSGPRFLMLDNLIFSLTGPCSYEFLFPYQLNGKIYLQTGSTCCDCGWVIDQIFEVSTDSIYLVFQDDSYST